MCLKIPFISNNIHFALGLVIFYFRSLRTIVIFSLKRLKQYIDWDSPKRTFTFDKLTNLKISLTHNCIHWNLVTEINILIFQRKKRI